MTKARLFAALGSSVVILLSFAAPAVAQDPRVGAGVITVDGIPFEAHRDNEPHVGCTFQIDFYNFEERQDLFATYMFHLQPPTGGGMLVSDSVFIGEDPAGGGTDLDASVTVDLSDALAASGVQPHDQGFHIKLTIDAQGQATPPERKHKVFWVECEVGPGRQIQPPYGKRPIVQRPRVVTVPAAPQAGAGALAVTGGQVILAALVGMTMVGAGTLVVRRSRSRSRSRE